ncbi:hypothetical protein Peur_046226 [Populus x canadensis]
MLGSVPPDRWVYRGQPYSDDYEHRQQSTEETHHLHGSCARFQVCSRLCSI